MTLPNSSRPKPSRLLAVLPSRHLMVLGLTFLAVGAWNARAQQQAVDRFAQLRAELPTPNSFRTASGAPGPEYWQQSVSYKIDVELDEENSRLIGHERVTYVNGSPDELEYLWLHLEPNRRTPESHSNLSRTVRQGDPRLWELQSAWNQDQFDGSCKIDNVRLADGTPLQWTVVGTTMRIELPQALAPARATSMPGSGFGNPPGPGRYQKPSWVEFELDWSYEINDIRKVRARSGVETLDDGARIWGISQWFPRLCAYTDYTGWQHKEFLGGGEFALEFGDYDVSITAPSHHVVCATGELQDARKLLTEKQRKKLEFARTAEAPVMIISKEEADAQRLKKGDGTTKTWRYIARKVRDFSWGSSPAFMWDAQGVEVDPKRPPVMAMSYWPREGEPIWGELSTAAVVHTLEVYGRRLFPYPYPVAISVNGVVGGGMEYPMICFNGPRPGKNGEVTPRIRHGLISIVIHEVGHNWFPMIVNSDERQWAWMDEGLNTFVQSLAEREWKADYPSRAAKSHQIVRYMTSEQQVPIMSNADTLLNGGPNAYSKPSVALNILRDTVIGPENFDFALKTYANRWKFKRPEPADFFRTMEDASGVDLDWFWRGWFYTTDHVNQTLGNVRRVPLEEEAYQAKTDAQREMLEAGKHWYTVDIASDGIPMPVCLELQLVGGEKQVVRLPVEIWRKNAQQVSRLISTDAEVEAVVLDPFNEIADANRDDNQWPQVIEIDAAGDLVEPESIKDAVGME